MANINEKRLKYLEFVNRENNFRHLRYEEEIRPYLYMKAGDPRALDAYRLVICPTIHYETGNISLSLQ